MSGAEFSGLEMERVFAGARVTGRFLGWFARISIWRPVLLATVCWLGLAAVSRVDQIVQAVTPVSPASHPIGVVCEGHLNQVCHTTNDGTGALLPISASQPVATSVFPTGVVAWWFKLGATIFTIGAVTVGLVHLVSGGNGRRYQKRGGIREGVRSDWNAGKRDARNTRKQLRKAGNWRARDRARRHNNGHPQSSPTGTEAWVLAHADPPKQAKGRKAKKAARTAKKTEKDSRRMTEAEVAAEWDFELRRIRANRTGHLDASPTPEQIAAGVAVGDAMRVDAGGPADQVEAWRDVIEDPHETGPLPPAPPPPPFVAAPSPATPGPVADQLVEASTGGES